MIIKDVLKRILYSSGALPSYNRVMNKYNLTVVMFHRVLAQKDPRWGECNLEWTLSDTVFKDCLVFFKAHYNIVSLEALIQSFENNSKLPDNPLLITFDDGWSDNFDYAFPLLQKFNIPATIFLAGDAIDRQEPFWEERIWGAYKTGGLNSSKIRAFITQNLKSFQIGEKLDGQALKQMICLITENNKIKKQLIKEIVNELPLVYKKNYMLSSMEIQHMDKYKINFGGHGYSHFPLTCVEDEDDDIKKSISALSKVLPKMDMNYLSMSVPHGKLTSNTLKIAQAKGFKLVFTSEKGRIPLKKCRLVTNVIKRYPIFYKEITSPDGELLKYKLAFQLFF